MMLLFGGCFLFVAINGEANRLNRQNGPVIDGEKGRASSPPKALFDVVVTRDEFAALADGISYEEAERIIGAPGEEVSRNTLPGAPGVMPSITTVMYVWKNWDGSNMNAMFQNNKLMQKSQFGLK